MRRFRFVGDPSGYNWKISPIKGEVYDFDRFKKSHGDCYSVEVFECFHSYEDWQEVFDEPQVFNRVHFNEKPLHKDTDLGYFAGLTMAAIIKSGDLRFGSNAQEITFTAFNLAKEIIKQLDKETK